MPPKKRVFQYTKEGQFISAHDSLSEAANAVGVRQAAISIAVRDNKRIAGYLWRFYEVPQLPAEDVSSSSATRNVQRRPVSQYTLDGQLIRTYRSAVEAAKKTGGFEPSITCAARGDRKTSKGFLWRFYEVHQLPDEDVPSPYRTGRGCCQVSQYALNGKLIKTFPSIVVAANATGVSASAISGCVCGKMRSAGRFLWRRYELPQLAPEELEKQIGKEKEVYQYTLGGKYIAAYSSITVAARAIGVSRQLISATLKGKGKSAGGFLWRFYCVPHLSDDDAPNSKELKRGGRRSSRPVAKYSPDGKLLAVYSSVNSAAKASWLSATSIYGCLSGKYKTSGGFKWMYCAKGAPVKQEVAV